MRSGSFAVALGSGLLGLLGLVATVREFQYASTVASNDPEGLVTAFAAVFALTFLLSRLFALGEAGLLAALASRADPGPWARGLLVTGAAAGGLAMLPRAAWTAVLGTDVSLPVQLFGAWWVLAVLGGLGLFCLGIAAVLSAIGPLTRPGTQVTFLAVVLAGVAGAVLQALGGAVLIASLAGLASLVALWAGWLTAEDGVRSHEAWR